MRSGWRTFKGQPLIPNVSNVNQHCSGQIYSIEAQRCTARANISGHKRELHVSLLCIALRIITEAQSCMVETIIASHVKIELNMHDSSSRWSWNLASRVHFFFGGTVVPWNFVVVGLIWYRGNAASRGIIYMANWQ